MRKNLFLLWSLLKEMVKEVQRGETWRGVLLSVLRAPRCALCLLKGEKCLLLEGNVADACRTPSDYTGEMFHRHASSILGI